MQTTRLSGGRRRRAALAVALAALLTAAPAVAQQPAPGAPVQPPPSIATSIARLHRELHIAPPQEAAFNGFANAMRENARAAERLPPPNRQVTAVEGLRLSIRAMQQELAGLRRLLPALETLYRSLSPQQRRTADEIFSRPPG
jgi:periplasmic protein CpxP/Spy